MPAYQLKPCRLRTFWFTFPDDIHLPLGIGVTAYSDADAIGLLKAHGIDVWFADAKTVRIVPDVRFADLDPHNVLPNTGPMQFRGIWYPCLNIGFGAPDWPRLPEPLLNPCG